MPVNRSLADLNVPVGRSPNGQLGHRQANLHRDPSSEEWISGEAFAGFDAFCAGHGVS
jgi:hypothetical protein